MGTENYIGDDILIIADPYDTSDHIQDDCLDFIRFFFTYINKSLSCNKSINKTKIINEHQKTKIKLEISIMKTLSSSNYIVKIYEIYQN